MLPLFFKGESYMYKNAELETPLNANERFLYAVAVRLDAIIEQNNSIIDVLSKTLNVSTTDNKSEHVVIEKEEKSEVKEEIKVRPSRKKKV
jgi:hypothetical protein